MRHRLATCCALLASLSLVSAAHADDTGWRAALRIVSISPGGSSTGIATTGSRLEAESATSVEVAVVYGLSWNWAVELAFTSANLDLSTSGGGAPAGDAGSVRMAPLVLTLQYRFERIGRVQPYVGFGGDFTHFSGYRLSDMVRGGGVSTIDFPDSVGFASQVGADVAITDKLLANVDVKYIRMPNDVDFRLAAGGNLDTVSFDPKPWVFGIGVTYRF
jgi:outer membrane protein